MDSIHPIEARMPARCRCKVAYFERVGRQVMCLLDFGVCVQWLLVGSAEHFEVCSNTLWSDRPIPGDLPFGQFLRLVYQDEEVKRHSDLVRGDLAVFVSGTFPTTALTLGWASMLVTGRS